MNILKENSPNSRIELLSKIPFYYAFVFSKNSLSIILYFLYFSSLRFFEFNSLKLYCKECLIENSFQA